MPSVAVSVPVLEAGADSIVSHSPLPFAIAVLALLKRRRLPELAALAPVYLTVTVAPGVAPEPHTFAPLRWRIIPDANLFAWQCGTPKPSSLHTFGRGGGGARVWDD